MKRVVSSRVGSPRVAIQGELGAFSHEAAERMVPGARIVPCTRSLEVFDRLGTGSAKGSVDVAVVPIENSLAVWDESQSPYRRVALIRIPKQDIEAGSAQDIVEGLTFDPWHSLPDHRPLGSINRARRVIYEALSEFRHEANGLPRQEPTKIPW